MCAHDTSGTMSYKDHMIRLKDQVGNGVVESDCDFFFLKLQSLAICRKSTEICRISKNWINQPIITGLLEFTRINSQDRLDCQLIWIQSSEV